MECPRLSVSASIILCRKHVPLSRFVLAEVNGPTSLVSNLGDGSGKPTHQGTSITVHSAMLSTYAHAVYLYIRLVRAEKG